MRRGKQGKAAFVAMEEMEMEYAYEEEDEDDGMEMMSHDSDDQDEDEEQSERSGQAGQAGSIQIQAWNPDTPYMAALESAADAEVAYQAYLEQRHEYGRSPAFFLDCANQLYSRASAASTALARRVLTSVLELALDDPALLRVVAYRLSSASDWDLATLLLMKVLSLRPEEPQSLRDLALVLASRGEAECCEPKQVAVDLSRAMQLLYEVVLGTWHRFDEIEVIALMELNRLIWLSQSQLPPGVAKLVVLPPLPGSLSDNLDLDMRISLVWDKDLTDMDLHVIEPFGEVAMYSNRKTRIGGLVSRDFTDGYGPEEYVLRRAPPGNYSIEVKYYGTSQQGLTGPATVQAVVYTHWGKPTQKRQELTLRLDTVQATERVGVVTIEGDMIPTVKKKKESSKSVEIG